MLTIPPAPSSPPTSSAKGTLRSPSAPTVLFVRDQRSRPNSPAFTSKPQAAVRAHRSSSFAPRVRDQTRPAFTPVHVRLSDLPRPSAATIQVRSRPEVTTKPAQRSLPSASSVHVHRSRSFTPKGHDQHDQRPRPDFVSFLGAPTPCRVGPHNRVTRVVQTSKRRAVCLAWLQCVRGCRGVL